MLLGEFQNIKGGPKTTIGGGILIAIGSAMWFYGEPWYIYLSLIGIGARAVFAPDEVKIKK